MENQTLSDPQEMQRGDGPSTCSVETEVFEAGTLPFPTVSTKPSMALWDS